MWEKEKDKEVCWYLDGGLVGAFSLPLNVPGSTMLPCSLQIMYLRVSSNKGMMSKSSVVHFWLPFLLLTQKLPVTQVPT